MRPLGEKGDDWKVQEIGVNSASGLVFVVPVRHRLLRLLDVSGLVGIENDQDVK